MLPCFSNCIIWRGLYFFSDYRSYAVFCLLKVGTEIFDTTMISDVDRSMTDITFEDVILLWVFTKRFCSLAISQWYIMFPKNELIIYFWLIVINIIFLMFWNMFCKVKVLHAYLVYLFVMYFMKSRQFCFRIQMNIIF